MTIAPHGRGRPAVPRHRVAACALAVAALFAAIAGDAHAAARFGDRPLRLHASGHDVRVLQSWLTRLGQPTTIDGQFGRGTRRSLRRWERSRHLTVDGRLSRREARIMRGLVERRDALADAPAPTGRATLAPDGRTAVAPAGAPQAVVAAIAAANRITHKPYRYGGGHGSFRDSGYDCSGAVSYALHGGGLLRTPRDSTGFESFGRSGAGRWISVYANAGHAYAVIAGLRFDTSGRGENGPRWRTEARSGRGYVVRHPAGL